MNPSQCCINASGRSGTLVPVRQHLPTEIATASKNNHVQGVFHPRSNLWGALVVLWLLGPALSPGWATPPAPATGAACQASTQGRCWVSGPFTIFGYSAGAEHYRVCRSEDTLDWGGCQVVMDWNTGTSFLVSGTDLPNNGYSRYYRWAACDSTGCTRWSDSTPSIVAMDVTPPPAPGAAYRNCAYSNPGTSDCWYQGNFILQFPAANDVGSGVDRYQICRSQDSTGGFAGCQRTLSTSAPTNNFIVSGSELPSDGYRRAFWFRAFDAVSNTGAWGPPFYVRIDRHAPSLSASQTLGASAVSLQFSDTVAGAGANSGLEVVRYRWNASTGTACDAGTTLSGSSASIAIPAGSPTLYACAKDRTGRITTGTWAQFSIPTPDAGYVTQAVPTSRPAGLPFNVSVTMKNTGTTTWTNADGYVLVSRNPADNQTWGPSRIYLSSNEAIAPGQQKTFTFTATAPTNLGSYNFQWQMQRFVGMEPGVPFGAASPNVAIQITNPDNSQFISQTSLPTTMTPGQVRSVSITFKNTGYSTWSEIDKIRLGSNNPNNNQTWGLNQVLLTPTEQIAPGAQKTFTFNVTAPLAEGTYNFQWRMVRHGVRWIGQRTLNQVITVQHTNDSRVISGSTVPSSMQSGQTEPVWVSMKNIGSTTWTAAEGYRLVSRNPANNTHWGLSEVSLLPGESIAPGQIKRFDFEITAPPIPGSYNFQWRMVQDSAGAFGRNTPNVVIAVGTSRPEITSITPEQIPAGELATLTITGSNLQNAIPRIALDAAPPTKGMLAKIVDPITGEESPRYTPSVNLVSVDPAGQSMTVTVDASHPDVTGWYNLFADNGSTESPEGRHFGQFRVVEPGPNIDGWTPSEMSIGSAFFFSVFGTQLSGAQVTSLDSNVVVSYVENDSDSALAGLIYALNGAPIGEDVQIAVTGGGVTKRVPIRMHPDIGDLSTTTQNVASSILKRVATTADTTSAGSLPPIYLQQPRFNLEGHPGQSSPNDVGQKLGGDFCLELSAGTRYYETGAIFSFALFDDSGQPIPIQQIAAAAIGTSINLNYVALVYEVGFSFDAWLVICTDSFDAGFCVQGVFGLHVPGIFGFRHVFSYCDGISLDFQEDVDGGSVSDVSWTASDACMAIDDYCPPGDDFCVPNTGNRSVSLTLDSCCQGNVEIYPELTISSPFLPYGGTYSGPLDPLPVEVAPEATCSPLELKAFVDVDGDFDPNAPEDDAPSFIPGQRGNGTSTIIRDGQCDQIDLVIALVDPNTGEIARGVSRELTLYLRNTSHYKGVAMNYGTDEGPDFRIQGGMGSNMGAKNLSLTGSGDGTLHQTLDVCDYGGHTTVALVNLMPQDGPEVELELPRLDSSGLPQAGWRTADGRNVSASGAAASDDDANPFGSGPPSPGAVGDGISAYEEYRGFIIGGQHQRTDPAVKDLFVFLDVPSVAPSSLNAAGLQALIHSVRFDEYDPSERWINFNNSNVLLSGVTTIPTVHSDRQRILRVLEGTFSEGSDLFGAAAPLSTGPLGNDDLVPNDISKLVVFSLRIEEYYRNQGRSEDIPAIKAETVLHEIGHGINICHKLLCALEDPCSDGASHDSIHSVMGKGCSLAPQSTFSAGDVQQLRLHR